MIKKNMTRNAFTLAEVLITLGVIGVVAAMTLPTLIQNYKKKEYSTRVHKSYAEILQAIRLSEARNGPLAEWSCNSSAEFFDTYIKPYYKDLKQCTENQVEVCGTRVSGAGVSYLTNSGVGIAISCNNNNLYLMIDVNAGKKPNRIGVDAFYFDTVNQNKVLLPYGFDAHPTRDQLLQGFEYHSVVSAAYKILSCKKEKTEDNEMNRHGCTLLLYLDNWDFKDDYPWE